MSIKEAFDTIKKSIQDDPAYAWSWHCNITMMVKDSGVSHKISNEAAARFMDLAFNVDTRKNPLNSIK